MFGNRGDMDELWAGFTPGLARLSVAPVPGWGKLSKDSLVSPLLPDSSVSIMVYRTYPKILCHRRQGKVGCILSCCAYSFELGYNFLVFHAL